MASFSLTGLTSSGTYTCSYGNVSDTCTVTVSTHLFAPLLDGTDNIYTISGTTTVTDGVMSGGSSYLTDGWDNTIDWQLTFEAYHNARDGQAWGLYAPNQTQRDYNVGKFMPPSYNKLYSYVNGSSSQDGNFNGLTYGSWQSWTVTKIGNTLTVQIGDNAPTTHTYRYSEYPTIHIGTDTWGNTMKLRNIIVDPIQPLFYDDCSSSSRLSEYGAIRPISSSTTTSYLEYNSTENAYYVHANGDWGIIPITALNGLDNYKITAEFKTRGSGNTYQGGLGFIAQTGTNNLIFRKYGTTSNIIVNSSSEVNIGSITNASSRWHKFEIIKQGRNYTVTLTDMTSGNVVGTTSYTYSSDTYYVGFMTVAGTNYGSYVRNIKVEPI